VRLRYLSKGYALRRDNLRGLAGVVLAIVLIGMLDLLKPGTSSAPDYECRVSEQSSVEINILSGESGASIAAKLEEEGVVKSSESFFRVAVADARAASIAPGVHIIDREICAVDALTQLLDSKRIANLIAINEGAWISEIKSRLLKIGYSKGEIEAAFSSVKIPQGFRSLEGLLFPSQYSFASQTPLSTIIETIVKRGLKELEGAGIAQGSDGFTPAELLTIASLIEAEGDPADYRKVSQVVRNRLKIGMPLQFDSTVHYIMELRGSIFLSTKSTLLKSPYNTYRNYGLPPTPINNPGRLAMEAAVNPEAGNWLYFITVAPRDTRFTADFSQFNEWKQLYRKNLRSGKFE
jgi:UPF0755 protein